MMENEREKVKGDGFCSYLGGVCDALHLQTLSPVSLSRFLKNLSPLSLVFLPLYIICFKI